MNLTPVFDMLEEAGLPGGGKKNKNKENVQKEISFNKVLR